MPWPTIPKRQRRIATMSAFIGVGLFLVLLVPVLGAVGVCLGLVYGVYRLVRWGLHTDRQEQLVRDLNELWTDAPEVKSK